MFVIGTFVSAGYQCLKEDAEQVTGLLAELLTAPLLPEDKLRLYKGQVCCIRGLLPQITMD